MWRTRTHDIGRQWEAKSSYLKIIKQQNPHKCDEKINFSLVMTRKIWLAIGMENEIWGTVQSAGKITYPTQLVFFCKLQEHSHAGDEPHGKKVILTGNVTSQGVMGYAQMGFCAVESKHIFGGFIMDPLLWSFCNNYPLLQQYNNWHLFAILWMKPSLAIGLVSWEL